MNVKHSATGKDQSLSNFLCEILSMVLKEEVWGTSQYKQGEALLLIFKTEISHTVTTQWKLQPFIWVLKILFALKILICKRIPE